MECNIRHDMVYGLSKEIELNVPINCGMWFINIFELM